MLEALRDRLQADANYYERMMYQASNDGRKDDECHHAGRKKEAESLLEFLGSEDWAPTELVGLALLASVLTGGDNPELTNWIYKNGPRSRCPRCGNKSLGTSGDQVHCQACDWRPSP